MTMQFETIAAALTTILGDAQGSDFVTVGYQERKQDADEFLDELRNVQVFYSSGVFPKASGRRSAAQNHAMQFVIQLTVSKASVGDLATLNNPASTALQLATAIAGLELAEKLADESLNTLARLVYQIVMSAENIDIGLSKGNIANTWIESFDKDKPNHVGELVVLRGRFIFSCQAMEDIVGVTPETGEAVEITIKTLDAAGQEDPVQQTEVKTTTTP